jgi:hypothetical protein
LNNGRRRHKGEEPVELRASQSLKPAFSFGKFRSKFESDQIANFCASNAGESFRDSLTLDCKVIDSGDSRLVTAIFAFKESLDSKSLVDVAKKVLDGLVLHHRPFRSYGTLKNTDTLRIMVKKRPRYLLQPTGNPEIIVISWHIESSHVRTHFLKPYFEASIKNRDEGDWLLPWSLGNC